jgi:hypothetical protein
MFSLMPWHAVRCGLFFLMFLKRKKKETLSAGLSECMRETQGGQHVMHLIRIQRRHSADSDTTVQRKSNTQNAASRLSDFALFHWIAWFSSIWLLARRFVLLCLFSEIIVRKHFALIVCTSDVTVNRHLDQIKFARRVGRRAARCIRFIIRKLGFVRLCAIDTCLQDLAVLRRCLSAF